MILNKQHIIRSNDLTYKRVGRKNGKSYDNTNNKRKAILLHKKGWIISKISEKLDVPNSTIGGWITAYKKRMRSLK
jgi:hypothetical protein